MTVAELLSRISSRELTEWEAYYGLEPFGQERGDLQAGIVAAVIENAFKEKGDKASGPGDFLLTDAFLKAARESEEEKSPNWQAHLAFAQMMASAGFGTITTKEV